MVIRAMVAVAFAAMPQTSSAHEKSDIMLGVHVEMAVTAYIRCTTSRNADDYRRAGNEYAEAAAARAALLNATGEMTETDRALIGALRSQMDKCTSTN